ncbi:GGDEF domain-containing protein [Pseudomonas agarici]|uniref:GGDEF domain-containing protein n=1 Tax=Pseudomonas agarici TaxID=46677 RepID=UPI0002F768B8|nr:diguanylate cyclase [Pseudomonas agarici]NWB92226.1 diguanylate cyclase [Pseudomonas agarici]NWC07472.1 diguanylate cyclase [Pseudomonas agarici]SEK43107.1 response regulator receiver modulated diguanylate cyclase [Pseudomonas agarici]
MPNPDLSILLVSDDHLVSSAFGASLQRAGYQDIRQANDIVLALEQIDQRAVSVLVCAASAGLKLATKVRQRDEMNDHATYVLLISSESPLSLLDDASDNDIDDLIAPEDIERLLLTRVLAADRQCSTLQRLRQENRLLRQNIASLEQRNLVDALTGLGNARYLRQKLTDSLRQVQARGGAICYLLIGVQQANELQRKYGNDFYDELLQGIARRLQQLVRPLDMLARLDDQHFVLMTLPADLQDCAPSSFKRLYDGLNLKPFMTTAGPVELKAGVSLVGLDSKCLPLDQQTLFDEADRLLAESYADGVVSAKRLPARD